MCPVNSSAPPITTRTNPRLNVPGDNGDQTTPHISFQPRGGNDGQQPAERDIRTREEPTHQRLRRPQRSLRSAGGNRQLSSFRRSVVRHAATVSLKDQPHRHTLLPPTETRNP